MANYGTRADGTILKTQWETILYYLQTNECASITSWQAIKDFGFTRLSAIVKSIEEHTGIRLERRDVKVSTRYGGHTRVTMYWYQRPDSER